MKTLLLIILISFTFSSYGTSFVPLSFEKQLRSASAVLEGRYLGSSTIRTSDEQVMTQANFEVKRAVGFSQSEMTNKKIVSVLYPGGTWQGITYSIPGAPQFSQNEEVFLILDKTKFGYTLSNFSLGKYSIVHEGGEKFLVSAVFPQHPQLGNIPFPVVEKKLHEVFRSNLDDAAYGDRHIVTNATETERNLADRAPASADKISLTENEIHRTTGVWLMLLFASLGIFTIWFSRKAK